MCRALCKPDPLMGQLTEPIPRAQHLPSPTFPSPLGLSGSLVPHPTTASTQTKGGRGRTDLAGGAKMAPPAPPLPKGREDTTVVFRWFGISCLVLSTRQGLGRGMKATCPTAAALPRHLSTLAVLGLSRCFAATKLFKSIYFPPHQQQVRKGREGKGQPNSSAGKLPKIQAGKGLCKVSGHRGLELLFLSPSKRMNRTKGSFFKLKEVDLGLI